MSSSFSSSLPHKVALEVSLVLYSRQDLLGQLLAYASLSPIYCACYYISAFLIKRDITTILICAGQVLSLAINFVLKRVIKQPRPMDLLPEEDDFGMPSNHSQFTAYFAVIYCMYLMKDVVVVSSSGSISSYCVIIINLY